MTKSKYHTYVLVMSIKGPKFVTKLGMGHTYYWDGTEKPMEFSKDMAESMCCGLAWNGTLAFPVTLKFEVTEQPFDYSHGEFEWKYKKDLDKSEN